MSCFCCLSVVCGPSFPPLFFFVQGFTTTFEDIFGSENPDLQPKTAVATFTNGGVNGTIKLSQVIVVVGINHRFEYHIWWQLSGVRSEGPIDPY